MVYNGVFHGIFKTYSQLVYFTSNNGYVLIRLTTYKLHYIANLGKKAKWACLLLYSAVLYFYLVLTNWWYSCIHLYIYILYTLYSTLSLYIISFTDYSISVSHGTPWHCWGSASHLRNGWAQTPQTRSSCWILLGKKTARLLWVTIESEVCECW